jgi:hypothetical protein
MQMATYSDYSGQSHRRLYSGADIDDMRTPDNELRNASLQAHPIILEVR